MKNIIGIILLMFCAGACYYDVIQSHQYTTPGDPVVDQRVPRFCFTRDNIRLECRRTMEQCREAEFEERHVQHQDIKLGCRYLMIERRLLPYADQY